MCRLGSNPDLKARNIVRLSWLDRLISLFRQTAHTNNAARDPNLRWVEDRLHELARIAWLRSGPPNSVDFLLNPAVLPDSTLNRSMEQVLEIFYGHALKWASGFEIPFRVPKVGVKRLVGAVGQYRIDDGYVLIDMSPNVLSCPPAFHAVLAHEACHHILDLSGLNTHRPEVDEPMTDLAIFVCGFGEVFRRGQSTLAQMRNDWRTTHLGYLTQAQYDYAAWWVLNAHQEQATSSDPDQTAPVRRSTVVVEAQRKKALARFGGDVRALDRLLDRERKRNPNASELDMYCAVCEQLGRDRR